MGILIDIEEILLERKIARREEEEDLIASGIEPISYRYETQIIEFHKAKRNTK